MYEITVNLNNKKTLTAITATFNEAHEICTDILLIEKYVKVSEQEQKEYNGIEVDTVNTEHFAEYKFHGKTIATIDLI